MYVRDGSSVAMRLVCLLLAVATTATVTGRRTSTSSESLDDQQQQQHQSRQHRSRHPHQLEALGSVRSGSSGDSLDDDNVRIVMDLDNPEHLNAIRQKFNISRSFLDDRARNRKQNAAATPETSTPTPENEWQRNERQR